MLGFNAISQNAISEIPPITVSSPATMAADTDLTAVGQSTARVVGTLSPDTGLAAVGAATTRGVASLLADTGLAAVGASAAARAVTMAADTNLLAYAAGGAVATFSSSTSLTAVNAAFKQAVATFSPHAELEAFSPTGRITPQGLKSYQTVIDEDVLYAVDCAPIDDKHSTDAIAEQLKPTIQVYGGLPTDIYVSEILPVNPPAGMYKLFSNLNGIQPVSYMPNYLYAHADGGQPGAIILSGIHSERIDLPTFATFSSSSSLSTIGQAQRRGIATFSADTGLAAVAGATEYVLSVQPISIVIASGDTSGTQTVSATNKGVLISDRFTCDDTGFTANKYQPRLEFTNATTITAYRGTAEATNITVRGYLIDFSDDAVESVEYGAVSFAAAAGSNTATVAAVDTARSAAIWLGNSGESTGARSILSNVILTDGTTVTGARNQTTGATNVGFCVVQFQPGVVASIQQRTMALADSNASYTDTITPVDEDNTMLLWNGITAGSAVAANFQFDFALTDADEVTLRRSGISAGANNIKYTVLEFVPGVINSIQRAQTTLTPDTLEYVDIPISAVDTNKSIVNFLGMTDANGNAPFNTYASGRFTSSTNVRVEVGGAFAPSTNPNNTSIEAIQFN